MDPMMFSRKDMGVRDRGSKVRVQEVKHKVKKVRHWMLEETMGCRR
jgi:hypothetical protein